MDNSIYINLARQSGLMRELSVIANNMANSDTTGFKREGAIFTEYMQALDVPASADMPQSSLSMGRLGAHSSDFASGELRQTGGTLDVAIDGEGFFTVATPGGERLTRAGHFMTNELGTLIMPSGQAVLDEGGGEIQIPLEINQLTIAGDGTISADGVELARLGLVTADATSLVREGNNLWRATGAVTPAETPRIMQGFLEGSNVSPVAEIARMIEVQRHYDAGQKLLEIEDDRIKQVVTTLRQMA